MRKYNKVSRMFVSEAISQIGPTMLRCNNSLRLENCTDMTVMKSLLPVWGVQILEPFEQRYSSDFVSYELGQKDA